MALRLIGTVFCSFLALFADHVGCLIEAFPIGR
jgi:hypothetical protein